MAIEEEIRILHEIQDLDCVPKVIDVGSEERFSCYIMEKLERISFEIFSSITDALQVIAGTASALLQVHARNIAHRDIKLENILRRKMAKSLFVILGYLLVIILRMNLSHFKSGLKEE